MIAAAPLHRRPRVWVMTNEPSPYQVELMEAVAQAGLLDIDVRWMRVRAEDQPRADRVRGFAMKGLGFSRVRQELRIHPRALWEAAFGRFDCHVLSGCYTSPTFLLCALILSCRKRQWVAWLERPRPAAFRMRGIRRLLGGRVRERLIRWLLGKSDRVLCMGQASVDAYRDMGVAPEKLLNMPYCCDTTRFHCASDADVARVRDRYGLEGKAVFLFSGQMIERKGVDTVIRAFEKLAAMHDDVALMLLGSGPMVGRYKQSIDPSFRDRIHFSGHLSQRELPAYFAAADVFVFPSRHDGWAVVVNEACAAGMPIIASRQTGAARELVEDGVSGFVVDCNDEASVHQKMEWFVADRQRITDFGQRSAELVEDLSARRGADRFTRHMHVAMGSVSAA